jgi:hypothetical protein
VAEAVAVGSHLFSDLLLLLLVHVMKKHLPKDRHFAGAAAKRLLTPFMRKGNHKFQNTKSQINSKFKKSKRLEFVPWNLEFICHLEFAVWNFAHRINIDNKLS